MRLFRFIFGKVIAALVIVAAVVFVLGLWQMKMLPGLYMAILCALFAVIAAAVLLLTWSGRGKLRMTVGIIFAVLGIGVASAGSYFVWQAVDTIDTITAGTTEIVNMGIYMRADDARTFDDVSAVDFQYGILQEIDREPTDLAVSQLNARLNTRIACREYVSPALLIEALLAGEVDAIILNQAFLQALESVEEYEKKLNGIREATLQIVEVPNESPSATQKPTKPGGSTAGSDTDSDNDDWWYDDFDALPDEWRGDAGEQKDESSKIKPFVVYFSGLDSNSGPSVRSCSDVNILAVVNPQTKQILLVSTPRDFYIPLSISNGIPDKLTHAGLYGINVGKDSIGMLYDVNVDYYFKVTFSGFKTIVEALDGITVYCEKGFTGTASKKSYTFETGPNELDGERALAYCRIRDAFALGDRQRGKNQMSVIKAVVDKILSPKLLTNYTQILNAVEKSVQMNIPKELIGELVAQQISKGGSWKIATYSVNGGDDYAVPFSLSFSTYVMRPNQNTVNYAKSLIQDVLKGKTVNP